MSSGFIGYQEALKLTLSNIEPLESEERFLKESVNYVAAEDLYALVNSPSAATSLKDGFAVRAQDIGHATPSVQVELKLRGVAAAGSINPKSVEPRIAMRILTGAVIPEGADAVVSEEYTQTKDDHVIVFKHAEPGRNILPKGCDVAVDELLIPGGCCLSPAKIGILTAAGHDKISVIRKPRVAIIATGDEVLLPGQPIREGKLFASNMMTLDAWCKRYGMQTSLAVVGDDAENIKDKLHRVTQEHDVILTSGGAWTGDRDLVARTLAQLEWRKIYHRIRIGPGKGIGFGFLKGTPAFILPGGPPSNLIAFLKLALPGLLKLAGHANPQLPTRLARLAETVKGQSDWTQFILGRFETRDDLICFQPLKYKSRLKSMAEAEGLLSIPEGADHISVGTEIMVSLLD
ncbi:MAG: molybdopterin molybdotransferase MoeA [Deltaproteobacteria bacterium]|nr:MAG: molybdopterin molybdotransferase MoeA [Deltaproteobacteria bacterium]